jgi:hypothetical protein
MNRKASDMNMSPPSPTFDPRIGYRDIITVCTLAITIGGGIYTLGNQAAEFRGTIAQIQRDFDHRVAAIEKLSIQYVPVIQGLEKSDGRQEDRIQSMSAAIGDIRKTNGELLSQMGKVREDVAGMKATIDNRALR